MNFHSLLRRSIFFPTLSRTHCAVCSAFGVEFLPPFFFSLLHRTFYSDSLGTLFLFPSHSFFFISSNNMIYGRRRAKMIQNSPRKRTFRVLSFHVCWLLLFFVLAMEKRKRKRISTREIYGEASTKKVILFVGCFIRKCLSSDSSEASIRFLSLFRFFVAAVVVVVDPILTEIFFNFFKAE